MDNKFYVSLEAARLLKEKGYDRECMAYYQNDEFRPYSLTRSGLSIYNKNAAPHYMNQYSAPTKAEAIDWFESKEMTIEVHSNSWNVYTEWKYYILETGHRGIFPTRLEAEDAAIIKALELL